MSPSRESQQWNRTRRHPHLPGEDLETFDLGAEGEICLFDGDNPQAYLIAQGVEVGTRA